MDDGSDIQNSIAEKIEEAQQTLTTTFNLVDFVGEVQTMLREASAPEQEHDPVGTTGPSDIHFAYFAASDFLRKIEARAAATQLLVNCWNDFGQRQYESGIRVYRAAIAWQLARYYYDWQDVGAAVRWSLLAHADDLLGQHERGGGAARQALETTFGFGPETLEKFAEVTRRNLDEVEREENQAWSIVAAFAEDVVTRFATEHPEASHLLARPSLVTEFPLSPGYYQALLGRLDQRPDEDTPSTQVGDYLEELAAYLFLLIPGWVPRKNMQDLSDSFENDLVISNLERSGNLLAELLGRHFLVECKNWSGGVGVRDVGYFLYRMRLTHCGFGVMMSNAGITGSPDEETNARGLIRRAFHEDGSSCVVVSKEDLDGLITPERTFWYMLLEKVERFRFGRPR